MGVVWRALDTTLDRDVAIKILPGALTGDAERLARFDREARLLASLNHPNVATIHGLHEAGGLHVLAMELVEGEDLAQRIARGQLPPDAALAVAVTIARGLEAAHEKGVVHRDLKPANVRIIPERRVKVLDFGLAKAFEAARMGEGATPTMSPTVTSAGTAVGVILGTASYMSPEQARGKPLDRRTDVWSFGCVLYELLTARRAFPGDTVTDTLAAIIDREPDWNALPAAVGSRVERLLRRCLCKDRQERMRDLGDVALVRSAPAVQPVASKETGRRWRAPIAWAIAGLALGVVATALLISLWLPPETATPRAAETLPFRRRRTHPPHPTRSTPPWPSLRMGAGWSTWAGRPEPTARVFPTATAFPASRPS